VKSKTTEDIISNRSFMEALILNHYVLVKNVLGKGLKGKKIIEESQEIVNVSEEIKPEPEPAKKKTLGMRRVKKKVTLSADDNIISDNPDAALELAKSISKTDTEEAEASRKVHATHARIMTESVLESAKKESSGRSSKSVVIQDTLSAPKYKPATSNTKIKGTGGSHEGTGSKPRVPDESTIVFATLTEGTGAKPGVPNEDKDIIEENVILKWGDEQDNEFFNDDNDDDEKDDKDGDADDEVNDYVSDTWHDDEDDKTKSDEDDIYKYKIRVRKDEDVEMKDADVKGFDKGDEEITNAAKEEAEKTLETKDDTKKTELPPSSSSLSVSLGSGDQFLKLSFDSSLVSIVNDSADANTSCKALIESKKTSKKQPGTGGSHEGTGSKPRVPDESTIVFATLTEGTGAKPGVPNEDKDIIEENVILKWGDEQDNEFFNDDNDDDEKDDKDGDADDEVNDYVSDTWHDDEDDKTKSDEDDIYKYKIRVRKDEDVEMKDADVKGFDKVQTSSTGNTFLLVVAFFFGQWEVPSGSGNFLTSSGNALCILFPTILP
nr:hypothetical protein [Tanacetum cinerariifolium]